MPTEIHVECPLCKQSVEVPEEMANELIDCPKCRGIIDVAAARHTSQVEVLPPPQIAPQPPPVHSYTPQPARRHTIFYYVFWGTVSLFATLAILLVGFVFLTGAGAGFLSALTGRTPNTTSTATTFAVRNLPALTGDEALRAKRLMSDLHVEKDQIEGTTWY